METSGSSLLLEGNNHMPAVAALRDVVAAPHLTHFPGRYIIGFAEMIFSRKAGYMI